MEDRGSQERVSVVVIDDEPALLRVWRRMLAGEEWEVSLFESPRAALEHLAAHPAQVVVVDMMMPEMHGIEVISTIKKRWPEIEVIGTSAYVGIDTAVEAMKRGAYDFLTKPYADPETVRGILRRASQVRAGQSAAGREIVGQSQTMREVLGLTRQAAASDAPVLIYGETGTGKELIARAVHDFSPRRHRPFFAVNCAALAETLLEEELFGHVKGAFTGALKDQQGIFPAADGGTVFLDEIGDMSARCQGMLLRTLQQGEVRPVGSPREQLVDVRVIAASNRSLEELCAKGAFRSDLFYRLNVIAVRIPPLRERPEDIPMLVRHFLARYSAEQRKHIDDIAPHTLERLSQYAWPGNVRELENAIRRAVVLAPPQKKLSTSDLPVVQREALSDLTEALLDPPEGDAAPFADAKSRAIAEFERSYLKGLLEHCGSVSAAARAAGLDRSNFKRLLRRHGITAPDTADLSEKPEKPEKPPS